MALVNLGEVCRRYIGLQAQYGTRYAKARPGQTWEGKYPDVLSAEHGDGRVLDSVVLDFSYHSFKIDETEALEFATRVLTYLLEVGHIEQETYDAHLARIAEDRQTDLPTLLNY